MFNPTTDTKIEKVCRIAQKIRYQMQFGIIDKKTSQVRTK